MRKNERWVKIDDFENYEISDHGRIKRLEHYAYTHNRWGDCKKHYSEKIYENQYLCGGNKYDNQGKYPYIILTNQNGQQLFPVHRLVATYFCDNPNNYNEVDHIDRNPLNNNYENLRWCTRSENCTNRGSKKCKQ